MFSWIKKAKEIIDSKKGSIIALFFIYLLGSLLAYFLISKNTYGPMNVDEYIFWAMTHSLYNGNFTLNEFHHYPLLYSLSILPAFTFGYPHWTYEGVKLLNSFYLTSVIFPAYLILRMFLNRTQSLLASMIILINPTHVYYPAMIMSENVFYPLTLWSAYLALSNKSSLSSWKRNSLNMAFGISLACLLLTRYIGIVLIPGLLAIWWINPDGDAVNPPLFSKMKLQKFGMVLLPLVIIIGLWILKGYQEGLSLQQILGFDIASDSNPLQLTRSRLIIWTMLYASYVVLIAGPMAGVILFAYFRIPWKSWREDLPRWFLIVGVITLFLIVACIRHSWRASYNYPLPYKIMGRYLVHLAPFFIISFYISITKIRFPNLYKNEWGYWLFSVCVSGIIWLAYLILYRGLFFLEKGIQNSGASSHGIMAQEMGNLFIPISFMGVFIFSWFLGRNKNRLILSTTAFLLMFYLVGDFRVFKGDVLFEQFYSIQVSHVIDAMELNKDGGEVPSSSKIFISADTSTHEGERIALRNLWVFKFRGYENVEIIDDPRLRGEPEAYVFVKTNTTEYRVDGVSKKDYMVCDCPKYELLGDYFTMTSTPIYN
jgi:hypothetical protein